MTVEAIRVSGEVAAAVCRAAIPTHTRILALEVIDEILQPILACNGAGETAEKLCEITKAYCERVGYDPQLDDLDEDE